MIYICWMLNAKDVYGWQWWNGVRFFTNIFSFSHLFIHSFNRSFTHVRRKNSNSISFDVSSQRNLQLTLFGASIETNKMYHISYSTCKRCMYICSICFEKGNGDRVYRYWLDECASNCKLLFIWIVDDVVLEKKPQLSP